MRLEPFAMERMQSTYENQVAFNLSESGVQPLSLGELVEDQAARDALMAEPLRYTQTNGSEPLREAIAALYPGAAPDQIQVTNGGSEANYITTWNLVEPGDEVVMMVPNYMQASGLARAFGATVREWPLVPPSGAVGRGHDVLSEGGWNPADAVPNEGPRREGGRSPAEAAPREGPRREGGWSVDIGELDRLVSPRTKLIVVCNPNNPTGARFEADDLDRIASIADRHGSWILSDEIYRGAELDGRETPTLWGRSDRVIVTSGLSKAYGLPGLRIGWCVGPSSRIASFWAYHDYTTIAPGALSDGLARHALEPARRERILTRTRGILNRNLPIIAGWLADHGALFSYKPPDAVAVVFARYHHAINSTELVTRLRLERSVLVVPGDHFGMNHYLRLGFGDKPEHLREALARLGDGIADCGLHPQSNPQSAIPNPQ